MNATYLNLAAQSPSIEVGLSITEKLQNDTGSKQTFYVCNSALKSCSINILHKKSICKLCYEKALTGIDEYKKYNNAKVVEFSQKDLIFFENLEVDQEILKEIELGVKSTIASQFRITSIDQLNRKWKKAYDLMYQSSKELFHFFALEIQKNNIKNFITFNGRLACSRPIIAASKKQKINFWVYDGFFNGKFPFASKNQMFHSLDFVKKNSIKAYIGNYPNSNLIAKEHIEKKVGGIKTFERSFTNHQLKNYIDPRINLNKIIISIFTSSDDEYRFIGEDWNEYEIKLQYEEINYLFANLDKNKYQIVVKMHPNQKYINQKELNFYKTLSNQGLILFPENKTDTYELINKSDYIINFCSSVGAEANYLRKKVIQIGPSIFRKLPVANYVNNSKECVNLIIQNKARLMPIRASVVWFNYLYFSNINLEAYSNPNPGVFYFHGRAIKNKFWTRIFSTLSKLIFQIQKGDYSVIDNFSLYLTNFIFSKNNVK